jgi:hypothetical protein
MLQESFEAEIAHVHTTIDATPMREFAIPHLVIDNVFPADLVARINDNWPEYDEGFFPEVPGNHVLQLYRRNYVGLSAERLRFWQAFNEVLWPQVVASVAEAFAEPATEVFGDLYYRHLSLDHPLTLMQADPNYPGHSMHHHYYHCPHWAFTMLLYIDPQDKRSRGTALHRLLPRDQPGKGETSYRAEDHEWRAEVAIDTFRWESPDIPDRRYEQQVVDYKCNRLFVFLDGPLALHSVPWDNPDHTPDPARAEDGGRHARRRILRSHVKVHHDPFYRKHSTLLPEPLEPNSYMRLLAPNAVLSAGDQTYKDKVLKPFFNERLAAYANAAEIVRGGRRPAKPPLWKRLLTTSQPSRDTISSRILERIP